MIVISKYMVPKGFLGITLYPFIVLRHKELKSNPILVNHEKIHLQQQLELLILPFFVWYLVEFIIRLVQYKQWHLAYRNISFEREAYRHETDLNYLKYRVFWGFLS